MQFLNTEVALKSVKIRTKVARLFVKNEFYKLHYSDFEDCVKQIHGTDPPCLTISPNLRRHD